METMYEKVRAILTDEMENAVSFSVPMLVETSVGDNWYEAK